MGLAVGVDTADRRAAEAVVIEFLADALVMGGISLEQRDLDAVVARLF